MSLFRLKGVLHYGIAGNADVSLDIGDVTIPKFWAHSGLWNWQVELYQKDSSLFFWDKMLRRIAHSYFDMLDLIYHIFTPTC